MSLSDSFPYGARLASVQRQFRAGLVVKLFCDFITDRKWKRLVIVAARRDHPLFFLINTEPTPYAKRTPRLADQQLSILQACNTFLDHDSWIDCSVAYDDFEMGEIEDALANDMQLILGAICKETAAAMIETI